MTPAVAAHRLLCSLALGGALGLGFGFLRPLKNKYLADGLFLILFGWVWLYLNFAICRGDIRSDCFWGLILGCVGWEATIGRLMRPFFAGIWKSLGILVLPAKKFLYFAKILFASAEKWVTIKCKLLFKSKPGSGGTSHGRTTKSARQK